MERGGAMLMTGREPPSLGEGIGAAGDRAAQPRGSGAFWALEG